MAVAVEICITSIQEARKAAELGVDSIELCTSLSCGGLTPSAGTILTTKACTDLPLRVLVRPRPGDFEIDPDDRDVLIQDVAMLAGAHATGVVIGALVRGNGMDKGLIDAVRKGHADLEVTFNRAIDRSSDALRVLEECMDSPVDRILTSGGCATAREGIPLLSEFVRRSSGSLRVAAAGGIGPDHVVELIERTGVQEIHFSAQLYAPGDEDMLPLASDPIGYDRKVMLDVRKVEGVLSALAKAGLR